MTNEEIIRSEAKKAAYRWAAYRDYGNSEKEFMSFIKEELQSFYTPTNKSIFLDEVYKCMARVLNDYSTQNAFQIETGQNSYVITLQKVLFYLRQEIDELPKVVHASQVINSKRDTVFISYSHADKEWLDILKRHFGPFKSRIEFWDDSHIKPGQKWESEIKAAISRAKVALLLLSADFFNSDFVTKKEIPPLLEAAAQDGATILFIVLKPFVAEAHPQLLEFQGLNALSRPFIRMDEADREELCVSMVRQILTTLS